MAIPVVFSWSGGKDSAMALHAMQRDEKYEVVSLLTTVTEGYERISMHGVRNELLLLQAEAMGLPVEEVRIPPQCPNSAYETRIAETISRFRERGVVHVAFGDIFLEDLRTYREQKLMQANMTALFPIWKEDTRELATRFVKEGFRAIVACIDPRKLDKSFVGRELDASFFGDLPADVDPCGENGEFHTFVFDGPIFRKAVAVRTGEVVERDNFVFCDLLPVV
ncbi:MAG TPA: diphthine--ammonia ligase [Verrucomicrobiae bacterium]|nr:diphthine--ammonia ligase [Verrucomicrobiae bacterium]